MMLKGGGGIINIILRKGKAQGINGSVVLSVGDPEAYGGNTNLNFRSDNPLIYSQTLDTIIETHQVIL